MKTILGTFLLLSLFLSCTHSASTTSISVENNEIVPISNEGYDSHDTFKIEIEGKLKSYLVSANLSTEFTNFKTFIDKFKNKPLVYNRVYQQDITGDKKMETIISRVYQDGNNWKILNQIILGKAILWSDTVIIDDSYCYAQWGEDSIYYDLKPYSSFYWSVTLCKQFIMQESGAKEFANQDITLNLRKNTLLKRKLKPNAIEAELRGFKWYLSRFKGYIISDQNSFNKNLFVWYEPEKSFVNIFTPQ